RVRDLLVQLCEELGRAPLHVAHLLDTTSLLFQKRERFRRATDDLLDEAPSRVSVLRDGIVELLPDRERSLQLGRRARDRIAVRRDIRLTELRLRVLHLLLRVAERFVGADEKRVRLLRALRVAPLARGGLGPFASLRREHGPCQNATAEQKEDPNERSRLRRR